MSEGQKELIHWFLTGIEIDIFTFILFNNIIYI